MESESEERATDRWLSELSREMTALPQRLEEFLPALRTIREKFYQETAAALQGRLNEHLESLPQSSYEDKREIAIWLGQLMRETGLAVRCEKTHRPGRIAAGFRDDSARDSRFHLEVSKGNGRASRTWTAARLPELKLQKASLRDESLARNPKRAL